MDSMAAVERGVTVVPKPSPNRASAPSNTGMDVCESATPSMTMPIVARTRPAMPRGTTRTSRSKYPEPMAPMAIASANVPRTSRCSGATSYRTRSTHTAAPMIAVASA